jgi:hypothetical protein
MGQPFRPDALTPVLAPNMKSFKAFLQRPAPSQVYYKLLQNRVQHAHCPFSIRVKTSTCESHLQCHRFASLGYFSYVLLTRPWEIDFPTLRNVSRQVRCRRPLCSSNLTLPFQVCIHENCGKNAVPIRKLLVFIPFLVMSLTSLQLCSVGCSCGIARPNVITIVSTS